MTDQLNLRTFEHRLRASAEIWEGAEKKPPLGETGGPEYTRRAKIARARQRY